MASGIGAVPAIEHRAGAFNAINGLIRGHLGSAGNFKAKAGVKLTETDR